MNKYNNLVNILEKVRFEDKVFSKKQVLNISMEKPRNAILLGITKAKLQIKI